MNNFQNSWTGDPAVRTLSAMDESVVQVKDRLYVNNKLLNPESNTYTNKFGYLRTIPRPQKPPSYGTQRHQYNQRNLRTFSALIILKLVLVRNKSRDQFAKWTLLPQASLWQLKMFKMFQILYRTAVEGHALLRMNYLLINRVQVKHFITNIIVILYISRD